MGFRTGAYATVWEVKPSANYTDVRLSISRKNSITNEYETNFSGYTRFVGEAHRNATNIKVRDRIKIGGCDVQNRYDKEKGITYYTCVVFTFEPVESRQDNNSNENNSNSTPPKDDKGFIDEELPFN